MLDQYYLFLEKLSAEVHHFFISELRGYKRNGGSDEKSLVLLHSTRSCRRKLDQVTLVEHKATCESFIQMKIHPFHLYKLIEVHLFNCLVGLVDMVLLITNFKGTDVEIDKYQYFKHIINTWTSLCKTQKEYFRRRFILSEQNRKFNNHHEFRLKSNSTNFVFQ